MPKLNLLKKNLVCIHTLQYILQNTNTQSKDNNVECSSQIREQN